MYCLCSKSLYIAFDFSVLKPSEIMSSKYYIKLIEEFKLFFFINAKYIFLQIFIIQKIEKKGKKQFAYFFMWSQYRNDGGFAGCKCQRNF